MRFRRVAAGTLSSLVVSFGLTGCISGLQFRADHRLHFTTPHSRSRVREPVTVSWRMSGFTVSGADGRHDDWAGYFAVFVDQPPMPMGKSLRWVARGDKECIRTPGCPSLAYLQARDVFTTTQTTVTIPVLPASFVKHGRDDHYVVVVLVDGAGRRIGEVSWYLQFYASRAQT